ncbi:hypothetical protein B0T14DRAFT_535786 [Immersiella caudata]|uniref:DUF1308 domain-containing protein n=1 Tax=Immersiella caudata TaxID=314043 RepID=A0AA39WW04_9PEZI|nr:hypothetical protein B0T14DRAFT_535786 [Immersiella caudata]
MRQEQAGDEPSLGEFYHAWRMCVDELGQLCAAMPPARLHHTLTNLHRQQEIAVERSSKKAQKGDLPSPHIFNALGSQSWAVKWAVVKKCRGLICVNTQFPHTPPLFVHPLSKDPSRERIVKRPLQERTVTIDAAVDSGATWIKFISVTPKALEYQVDATNWESDSENDEGDDSSVGRAERHRTIDGLSYCDFVAKAKTVVQAAKWNQCPQLHLVIPSLREGESGAVDRVLNYIRTELGGKDVTVTVSCANSPLLTEPPPELSAAIESLVSVEDEFSAEHGRPLTPTINLDPGVLISLVSDMHHGPIPQQPLSQQKVVTLSLGHPDNPEKPELDGRQDLLPRVLFPALRGRKLVCTKFAASYFRQVISSIATSSEETRASFILPPEGSSTSREELLAECQKWSNVSIPSDLVLPVEIVDDVDVEQVESLVRSGQLPPMALGVARDLSRLNCSVYLHGWANRLTTITGSRGIYRQVHNSISKHWKPDGLNDIPPHLLQLYVGRLLHRDKPGNWRQILTGVPNGGEVPPEVIRWTYPLTTWGRGINSFGMPDSKCWPGVGHDEIQTHGIKDHKFLAKHRKLDQLGNPTES